MSTCFPRSDSESITTGLVFGGFLIRSGESTSALSPWPTAGSPQSIMPAGHRRPALATLGVSEIKTQCQKALHHSKPVTIQPRCARIPYAKNRTAQICNS